MSSSAILDPALLSLYIPPLAAIPFLRHGFSTRACGNLATRYGPSSTVATNRRRFADAVGIDGDHVAHFALTHSSRVGLVTAADTVAIDSTPYRISIRGLLVDATPDDLHFVTPQGIPNQHGIDSLITTEAGVGLFMLVGDAAPVIMLAPQGRALALAHVGLAGTVNRVLEHTIQALCQAGDCRPEDLTVGIGPTAGPCCYDLSQSMTWAQVVAPVFFARFGPHTDAVYQKVDHFFFDLPQAIAMVLRDGGISAQHIHTLNSCTACPDSPFFPASSGVAGRFGALVALQQP